MVGQCWVQDEPRPRACGISGTQKSIRRGSCTVCILDRKKSLFGCLGRIKYLEAAEVEICVVRDVADRLWNLNIIELRWKSDDVRFKIQYKIYNWFEKPMSQTQLFMAILFRLTLRN